MPKHRNNWGVSYSVISFLERALSNHGNVQNVTRKDDIIFHIIRSRNMSNITLLCADEYAFSLALVHRCQEEFPDVNCISVGGAWNGYTWEAKKYCKENEIGLFVSPELLGALWHEKYWEFCPKDTEGNPFYRSRVS